MIDGFWIVQVETVQGSGGGVAVLTKGQILGGDNGFYYTGTYETDDASMKARVSIRRFLPGVVNIFGVESDYELNLTGTVNGDVIDGKATVVGQPGAGLVVRLTKKGNLP